MTALPDAAAPDLPARARSGPRTPDRHRRTAQPPRLPARARRPARARTDRDLLLPRRVLVRAGRVPVGVDVLHVVGVPHHRAAHRRAPRQRSHRPQSVLVAPFPAPAARIARRDLRRARRSRGSSRTRRQLQKLPGDAIACLAYVANWHFIAAGDSYAALFISQVAVAALLVARDRRAVLFHLPARDGGDPARRTRHVAGDRARVGRADRALGQRVDLRLASRLGRRPPLLRHRRARRRAPRRRARRRVVGARATKGR